MLNRRNLLSTAALIPFGLAACSQLSSTATQVSNTASSLATDAQTLTAALAGILPNIQTITGMTAATMTKIQGYVQQAQTIASSIASAVSTAANSATGGVGSLVTNLGSTVSSIAQSLGGFTLPPWVGTVISAAQALLPVILGAAGIAMARAPAAMTPDQARAILKAAASA